MRALEPSTVETISRDGVTIGYEVFEPAFSDRPNGAGAASAGARTVVFLTDPLVDGRAWKAQVPYLARHARVVVIDPRGNGRSSQPTDPVAYADTEFVADTVAVMDAVGVASAVIVAMCTPVWFAIGVAVEHPERVDGIVAIAPWAPFLTPPSPWRIEVDGQPDHYEGWMKDSPQYKLIDYRDHLEFFFGELFTEPHSSKQRQDCVGWGLQSSGEVQNAAEDGPIGVADQAEAEAYIARVRCPMLVIYGDEDRCQPPARARRLAELSGAALLEITGAGHLPFAREPVAVNVAIRDFLDQVRPVPAPVRRWQVPQRRQRRVLYLSSPIGLGHARRDLAIVSELRQQCPDVRVDWLAQPPLTDWLRRRGEPVHPASAGLASEVAHIDSVGGEHDLHAFEAIRQMDEILVANFMVFHDLVEAEPYDLWVGDEAWELDHFLFENPDLKRSAYAWLTDFVGWLPMTPDGREAELTSDYNAEMLSHIARMPRVRDGAIFVGEPEDVIDADFGPDLPSIRTWSDAHYSFSGYITGFDPADIADRSALRAEFGFGDEPVCLVAVGGSGVGSHLLRRAIEAYPLMAKQCDGLRMVVVTGPRIDPRSLPQVPGVEVHGARPDLHRRMAAADVALVQGGLSTTMELTAAGRPFVYVPLRHHFEQNIHVRHRLQRHRAGRCVEWDEATPERLADEVVSLIGTPVDYLPIDPGGAARAAAQLAALI